MRDRQGGGSRPPASLLVAGGLIAILAVVVVVASLTVLQLPDPVTEQARRTNNLYQVTLAISMIVFFGVTAGIIWAVFRYRRTGPELPEQVHGNNALEVGWTLVPVLILIGLFIPSFILVLDLKTPPAQAELASGNVLVVEAIGHQWWWEFDYPAEGIKVQPTPPNYDNFAPPTMVIPVGQTILVKVRSTDVVHSFYAPNLLYKIQAIPGNVNEFHFKVEKPGSFSGQCYQFCGLRHSDMRFVIEAVEPAAYQRWVAEQKQKQGQSGAVPAGGAAGAGDSVQGQTR